MSHSAAFSAPISMLGFGTSNLHSQALRPARIRLAFRYSQWRACASASDNSNIGAYNSWIADQQNARNQADTSSRKGVSSVTKPRENTASAPPFPHATLFQAGAEEYARDMTRLPSQDFANIARETERAGLFAPCMVGAVEGQFLKMLAQIKMAKRVLDIGTFTGYSALAFAQGIVEGGEVVTIEANAEAANAARKVFATAEHGDRIDLLESDALKEVTDMVQRGEKFDIVFLDADKINYRKYYEAGLNLLDRDGILMADNAMCSLLFAEEDPCRQSLHDFAQFVRNDERVEQVMLTVREGILLVRKV